jgi:subtilisin family serine protease
MSRKPLRALKKAVMAVALFAWTGEALGQCPPTDHPTTHPTTRRDDDARDRRRDLTRDVVVVGITLLPRLLRRHGQPQPQAGSDRWNSPDVPIGETRFTGNEVLVEVAAGTAPAAIADLERRHRLRQRERLDSDLAGSTLLLEGIGAPDTVASEVHDLAGDPAVLSAQPNYLFELQGAPAVAADPLQYAALKLKLPQAHAIARGDKVLVGMIDSGVDTAHPELSGAIAGAYDALGGPWKPHEHGTAVAGLIVAHARLTGSAPSARLLAVRAFGPDGGTARGTSFNAIKGLDWLAAHGARVVNMSFAGPRDPALHRSLEGAYRRGLVLVAAAGNAGPDAPPLYPASDPFVVAVTATDAKDHIYPASNRGGYIQAAAPGVEVLVAAPDGGYQVSSGTSFAAAEVSGVAALMIERKPKLGPDAVKAALLATAKPLGVADRQSGFDPKLVDAYRALTGR